MSAQRAWSLVVVSIAAKPFTPQRLASGAPAVRQVAPPRGNTAAPSPQVRAALRAVAAERLASYDTVRAADLRDQIAIRDGVSPDNVLLCGGAAHAVQLIFSCLATSGTVLLPSICRSYHTALARLHGIPTARYAIEARGPRFALDAASLARAIDAEDPALVLMLNPHAPTGGIASAAEIMACVAHARGGLVLVDEAYHGFSREAPTVASQVRDHDNLLVARGFAKFFGLADLRIGYVLAHRSLIAQLAKVQPPLGVPGLASALASAALASERYYRAKADMVMTIKDAFARRMRATRRLLPYESHGNFLLVELPDAEAARAAVAHIHDAGIPVRIAQAYGLPQFLRIRIGTDEQMSRIADVLETIYGT